jgi:hypothetical protein
MLDRMRHAMVMVVLAMLVTAACENPMPDPAALDESLDPGLVPGFGAVATGFSDWAQAMNIETFDPGAHERFNTPGLEGCPFIARDGKSFFMASDRPGGEGGIDIWMSTRDHVRDAWGEPVNVGPPINSAAADFCPTLARDGHTFYFVSTRDIEGSCGGGDIYMSRMRADGEFDEPQNLGCGVNSEYNEFSPFPLAQSTTGPVLYFSSTRPRPGGGGEGGDIYMAELHGDAFGAPELVPGLNSLADDGHPNVRRDGLEIFFYSQRTDLPDAQGGPDIYMATRASTSDAWSTPVNLGPDINSDASETRPSLSWDGSHLYFGSSREGSSDVYLTTRDRQLRPGN